jgi:outer membrane protein OmpA-like peptidoglycan-associated protein
MVPAAAKSATTAVLQELLNNDLATCAMEGYTDTSPADTQSPDLGHRRAEATRDATVAKSANSLIGVAGRGASGSGAASRRVVIRVTRPALPRSIF